MNAARPAGWGQSLADGAPGIALLHIERARAGLAGWAPVHHLALEMTRVPVQANPVTASLFYGAPAVAYAMHAAAQPAYRTALATLDTSISTLIHHRLAAAHRRIDRGLAGRAREYDLISGLTGLGAYLLHRHRDHELFRDILCYLIRLTQPIQAGDETLPGWWAAGSPDRRQSPCWDGGHAGFGMAHGITGPLALLSTAMRHGTIVDGHADAVRAICGWLARWQASDDSSVWWPEVISRDELRAGAVSRPGPHRPSWCYGTPGIARALHMASLALGNQSYEDTAERALIGCLTDDRGLAHLTDGGLCHGWAGLIHTAGRAHADAPGRELGAAVATATSKLRRRWRDRLTAAEAGLLEGNAGITLAGYTCGTSAPSVTRWDTCLLVG